jgi:hypothetical protein
MRLLSIRFSRSMVSPTLHRWLRTAGTAYVQLVDNLKNVDVTRLSSADEPDRHNNLRDPRATFWDGNYESATTDVHSATQGRACTLNSNCSVVNRFHSGHPSKIS